MKTVVAAVVTILALVLVFISIAMERGEITPLLGCLTFGLAVWWITETIHHVGAPHQS